MPQPNPQTKSTPVATHEANRAETGAKPTVGGESMRVEWCIAAIPTIAALTTFALLAFPWHIGQVYLGGDLLSFNLPTRKFYADCLAQGDSPLWWPNVFCGYFLHGEGQVGIFHPWHWAIYRGLTLLDAFTLELWINYPVMYVGTIVLLRRIGLN